MPRCRSGPALEISLRTGIPYTDPLGTLDRPAFALQTAPRRQSAAARPQPKRRHADLTAEAPRPFAGEKAKGTRGGPSAFQCFGEDACVCLVAGCPRLHLIPTRHTVPYTRENGRCTGSRIGPLFPPNSDSVGAPSPHRGIDANHRRGANSRRRDGAPRARLAVRALLLHLPTGVPPAPRVAVSREEWLKWND
jgi:hypothetical protein